MKSCLCIAAALAAFLVPTASSAVGLADLVNPDDVMLRKPSQKEDAEKKAEIARKQREAREKAEAEQRAADAAAKKAAEEKRLAEEKAAAEAAAKKAAEEKRLAEEKAAEEKRLAEAKAAAEAAAKKAAEEKRLAEEKAAEERRLAEAKAAAEAAAKKVAEEKRLAEEKAAEERRLAEAKAAEEAAAKKKAAEEKRAAYLANPDPDERPVRSSKEKAAVDAGTADAAPSIVVEKKGHKGKKKEKGAKSGKGKAAARDAVITADRTDFDRKEGVILFDKNVFVNDEQYQMHADRLFVFLEGTNDLKRLVAIGNVAITNEQRTATCTKAVYTKAASRIVMYGDEQTPATLVDASNKKDGTSTVRGLRITYWMDTGMATVEKPVIHMPAMKGGNGPKDLFQLNPGKGKDE